MQLGKRILRRLLRTLTPNKRSRQLRSEVDYWRLWFETKGLQWPEDYSERLDPKHPLQDWIVPYADRCEGDTVEILDVGAGPLTKLGKVHPTKRLAITPTDQLADDYNRIIAEFGVTAPIRTEPCDAEKLSQAFGNRTFDIVHAENSIDHAQDALAALDEMLKVTRPGGFLLLRHAEHEGRNNNYSGLHQWDFLCEDGRFIVAGPGRYGPRHDLSVRFAGEAGVECWLDGECVYVAAERAARGKDEVARGTPDK